MDVTIEQIAILAGGLVTIISFAKLDVSILAMAISLGVLVALSIYDKWEGG